MLPHLQPNNRMNTLFHDLLCGVIYVAMFRHSSLNYSNKHNQRGAALPGYEYYLVQALVLMVVPVF